MPETAQAKKRKPPTLQELLDRCWCYYCEKDCDDLKVLISHQKAKHFRCERCNRRLNTAGGLSVHMSQVHKEQLTEVANALPNRNNLNLEIFGMEGIPDDVMSTHKERVTEAYFRAEADYRARTGNPLPGTVKPDEQPAKRVKTDPDAVKKRLAEHRARRAAEKAASNGQQSSPASASGFAAPGTIAPSVSPPPGLPFSPVGYGAPSTASPNNGPFTPFPPPPQPGFMASPPGQPPFVPPSAFSPPGMPLQTYGNGHASHFAGPPMPHDLEHSGPHRMPSHPRSLSPPTHALGTAPGLPQPAPGLPQRPAVQAPNLSKDEMANFHSGAPYAASHNRAPSGQAYQPPPSAHLASTDSSSGGMRVQPDDVDDLINSVTGQGSYAHPSSSTPEPTGIHKPSSPQPATASHPPSTAELEAIKSGVTAGDHPHSSALASQENGQTSTPGQTPAAVAAPAGADGEKKSKKDKKKKKTEVKMVYSDGQKSPEEKKAESASVTGVTDETVRDPQDAMEP